MSHGSSVGAEPHNYFSLAFTGGTWAARTATKPLINTMNVEQRIFLVRYPILQTLVPMSSSMYSNDQIFLTAFGIHFSTEEDCERVTRDMGNKIITQCVTGTERKNPTTGMTVQRPVMRLERSLLVLFTPLTVCIVVQAAARLYCAQLGEGPCKHQE